MTNFSAEFAGFIGNCTNVGLLKAWSKAITLRLREIGNQYRSDEVKPISRFGKTSDGKRPAMVVAPPPEKPKAPLILVAPPAMLLPSFTEPSQNVETVSIKEAPQISLPAAWKECSDGDGV